MILDQSALSICNSKQTSQPSTLGGPRNTWIEIQLGFSPSPGLWGTCSIWSSQPCRKHRESLVFSSWDKGGESDVFQNFFLGCQKSLWNKKILTHFKSALLFFGDSKGLRGWPSALEPVIWGSAYSHGQCPLDTETMREERSSQGLYIFFGRSEVCEYVMNNCISLLFDAESTSIYTPWKISKHTCQAPYPHVVVALVKARIRPPQALAPLVISDQCNFHSCSLSPARFARINIIQLRSVNSILQAQQKDLRSWRIRENDILTQQRWFCPLCLPFCFPF